MHDDIDQPVVQAEQVVSLDHLQALVHERGRVDRDLRTHAPGGMSQGLLDGCLGQFVARPAAEGATRGRHDDALEVIAPLAPQALGQRGML